MSLEAEVSRLANAIETLTTILSKGAPITAPAATAEKAPAAEAPKKTRGRPKAEEAAVESPVVEEAPVVEETPVVNEVEDDLGIDDLEQPVTTTITSEELKAKFSALAKTPGKGRDAVLAIFKKLGATNFDSIPESKYTEALSLINKA